MKSVWKRFLSLALCICMAFVLMPNMAMPANAALKGSVSGLRDNGIGLSWSSILSIDAPWIACDTKIEGSVISQTVANIKIDYSSTLKIENQKGSKATLFFDYVIEQNGGTIQFGSDTVSGSGSFQKQLNTSRRDKFINVKIKSGSTSAATKIRLTNVALVVDKTATATFLPAENGSYTLDGTAVTAKQSKTQSSLTAYHVVATPAAGYQFMGWYDTVSGQYISSSADAKLHIEDACSITAMFAPKDAALFETGWQRFDDLNAAILYAKAHSQSKITLVSDGAVSGSYTIPSGITLLIPSDEFHPCYTDDPEAVSTAPAAKPFRTLTMQDGSSITLASGAAISVGGRYYAAPGGQTGRVVGTHGCIKMASGSSITVQRGANLYAWGFISGSGAVSVESGGTVYEWYQVLDFRGGSASSDIGHKVFPFSQYAVQNVEVPMTLQAGAAEKVSTAVYTMSNIHKTSIPFIGDSGMFRLVSGSLTKAYDGAADRIIYTVSGEAQVNSLSLNLAGKNINSKDYVLPLTNNMTVNLTEGSKLTINQTAALLPGVEANIAKNAELKVSPGYSIYIYDTDEWGGYCGTYDAQYIPVPYAPGQTGKRAPLADAKVNVNGTLIADGGIYTTAGGADICSSEGTGVYKQQGAIGSETTTYQYTQQGGVKVHEIPITPAKLHNADNTYFETAKAQIGDIINYVRGTWGGKPCAHKNTEVRDAKEATCTEPGYTGDTYCKVCGDKIGTGTAIPAKGHSWNEGTITTVPTCENAGVKTYTCTVCNATKTEAIDATGHTPVEVAEQPATCTEAGHTAGTKCSVCEAILSGMEEIPATGHTEVIDAAKAPTCTETGLTEGKHCSVCNTVLVAQEVIPAKGHTEVIDPAVKPTCTEPGKTEGKHCSVCNEIIVAQTVIPAKGHTEVIDEAKAPTCTETGLTEGKHCSVCNAIIVAQTEIPATGHKLEIRNAVEATLTTPGYTGDTYCTVCNSLIKKGEAIPCPTGWLESEQGRLYYVGGEPQKTGWTVIDGKTYYLDTETGYAATGITTLVPTGATEAARCVFDGNGVFQKDVTGVYTVGNNTYWLNSGIIEEEAGLKRVVKENGEVNYYYFAVQKNLEERDGLTLSAAVKSTVLNGKDCWLHKTNGLALPEWGYFFDENGVIQHDMDTSKNGILKDGEDLYYYVDGIKAPAGMIKIGDDYYYANSKGMLIVSKTYYCSRTNGLMKEGTYAFDAEGKLIPGATDKNGIVKDDDGVLRYYVNGKVTYVGLIEIKGDFYYVRSNGEVVTNCVYWITWTHDLKEAGYYTFDENGKLTGTPKNGIVKDDDGVLRYYVNDKPTYAGLIKIGDDYYYVNSKCEVVHDCDYYITWTHDLKPQGRYHFDADGKLTGEVAPLKNGIYEEDGSLYFYRNGERTYAGLIQIDGDYYYVRSTCEVVHDRSYYVYWTHDLMPAGYYNFDSAGRMIMDS